MNRWFSGILTFIAGVITTLGGLWAVSKWKERKR